MKKKQETFISYLMIVLQVTFSLFLFINLFLINSEGRKKRKSRQIDCDDDGDFVSEEPKEKRVKQSKANVS